MHGARSIPSWRLLAGAAIAGFGLLLLLRDGFIVMMVLDTSFS